MLRSYEGNRRHSETSNGNLYFQYMTAGLSGQLQYPTRDQQMSGFDSL